ncbi:Uncharacterised protein [Mycobacterium tuberculosis]|nr:Uncharacterised protein [Mycobacterium tuberculosis]
MFCGLTSRCITPSACAASSAEAIWVMMATARGGVSGPKRLSTLSRSVPSTRRISKNIWPSTSP